MLQIVDKPSKDWPKADYDKAVQMWAEGKSASFIGAVVGKSRSAVLGKANRNRHDFPERQVGMSKSEAKKMATKRSNQRRKVFHEAKAPKPPTPVLFTPATVPFLAHDALAVTLMDLTENACKWPMGGEGAAITFCGAETEGKSYCLYHHKIGYRPKSEAAACL